MSRTQAGVLASVVVAGLVIAADVGGPLQAVPVLWFLLACPGLAITGLFQVPERLPRWILVLAISLTVDILAAETILYAGRWSQGAAYSVISAVTTICVATSLIFQRSPSLAIDRAKKRQLAVEELFQP